jgi:putative DNA primase/helicase
MWSRLKRVPFVHVIERPDPSVKARLRDPVELGPAVLAWAVRGCQEWQSEGIGTCGAVESSTHAYRQEMDPLDGFLSERVAVAPDAKATRKVLRASYDAWCKDNGVKYTLSARDFTQRIEKICTAATVDDGQGNRVRGWHGIRVLTDWEREEGQ